jgi:hypothetical protein
VRTKCRRYSLQEPLPLGFKIDYITVKKFGSISFPSLRRRTDRSKKLSKCIDKAKVVPVFYLTEHHVMKTYWGSGDIVPRIL